MPPAKTPPLSAMYRRLIKAYGPQGWWPAQTRFEVIVGAILTQNTNWGNVEKTLANLKKHKMLDPGQLRALPLSRLSRLIRPAGYFNVKARRLKNFMAFLFAEYSGRLSRMAKEDARSLRRKLLSVNGIGPETADSILLYAFNKPVFVVDAYTKRILYRHNFIGKDADYHDIQDIFEKAVDRDTQLFNEYHALIVKVGKECCKPKPLCGSCILKNFHYSVDNRCRQCHRALPASKQSGRVICADCRSK